MGIYERGDVVIHYEEAGTGFPLLLIAPGGMRSAIPYWQNAPWSPLEELAGKYRVIAMDQRNAGGSRAPITAEDGWSSYTTDQLALMDHLGVERFHVAGMCIGGPYCLGLVAAAPARVVSAVLFQPIGLDDNRPAFYEMFDSWARELDPSVHGELSAETLASFRSNMYDGDFLFNTDRDFVRSCPVPLLVLAGNDLYHPASVSREIAELAPDVEYVEHWKEPENVPAAKRAVADFLARHTPL